MRSDLPEGWSIRQFGDFATESRITGTNGLIAKKLTVKLYGKGVYAKDDSRPGSQNTKYFQRKAGQLIYSKLDFLNGAFALIPPELDGRESTADLPTFDLSKEIDPLWLLEYVKRPTFYERMGMGAIGSRKARRVSPSQFRQLELLVPPLPEQRKIAAILSSVDETIAATEAVIEQTRRVKEGLLQDLLTKGIGKDGRPHTRFKQTEIGEIPEGWEVRRLGEVLIDGPRNGISPKTAETGVPTFSIAAVRNGRIDVFGNLKYAKAQQSDLDSYRIKAGDLLLIRGNGNPALVGTAGLVDQHPKGCIYPDILMRLVPDSTVLSEYLLYTINSRAFHSRLLQKATTTNGTWKVNGKTVKAMKLAILPRNEQVDIVKRLNSIIRTEAHTTQILTSHKKTKAGLLQDLLTGKIRVSL